MKDSNPASQYLHDDKKREYFKLKAELIDRVSIYRKLLNDYLIEQGDKIQYEINELNGFDCQFRLINNALVEIRDGQVDFNIETYDIEGLKPLRDVQLKELHVKADAIAELAEHVVTLRQSMKAGV